jgi:catechol 2,3-dioxygenase
MSQSDFVMDPKMTMGPVALRVRDVEFAIKFYTEDLGLRILRQQGNISELAPINSSQILVTLVDDPDAKPPPHNSAGLYHFAILLPNRTELAKAYLALGNSGLAFDGYADHLVSEALYLADPDGNGIEIYADKPRNEWRVDADGTPQMGTYPLDIDSLLLETKENAIDELNAIDEGAAIGHVHLKVTEIRRSTDFYHYQLGLDLMNYWDSAAFLSAGGYHHHIGINSWESSLGSTVEEGMVGLEYFTIRVPGTLIAELCSRLGITIQNEPIVHDPDGIKIMIKSDTGPRA